MGVFSGSSLRRPPAVEQASLKPDIVAEVRLSVATDAAKMAGAAVHAAQRYQQSAEAVAAADMYRKQVRRVMGAAEWPWPERVLLDREKQPRFVTSVEEFLYEVQFGRHLNEVLVFPDGVRLLGQRGVMHPEIAAALCLDDESQRARSGYEVLERLAPMGMLDKLKGKVMYHKLGSNRGKSAGGSGNSRMAEKWEALRAECPPECRSSVYCAELRLLNSQPCDDGLRKKRKSSMSRTMRERFHQLGSDVRKMLFWDDFSEGFFVGGHLSAYDLHVDCIPTSNVGSIFSGHKLLAIWGHGEDTRDVMRQHSRALFAPPISGDLSSALDRACCVAMAPPGSVYVFSGVNAHTVVNVGFTSPPPAHSSGPPLPCLCVSSYEAFVGLDLRHADVLLETCNRASESESDEEDILDFEEEVAENLRACIRRVQDKSLAGDRAAAEVVARVLASSRRMRRYYEEDVVREEAVGKRRKVSSEGSSSERSGGFGSASPTSSVGEGAGPV